MRHIEQIILHCAATPNGKAFSAKDIDKWHKEQGWTKIGYHFVIKIDGSVDEGRRVSEVGAHAVGFNLDSIGICLIGTDKFTQAQWDALKVLVTWLKAQYPEAEIVGHRDLPNVKKECPGFSVKEWQVEMEPSKDHILTAP